LVKTDRRRTFEQRAIRLLVPGNHKLIEEVMMPVFEKSHPKIGGRVKGTRNRLGTVFLEKLLKEFDEFGEEAIRICRVELPHEFLKIVASILPKEFEIIDSRLKEISDDELDLFIELARRQLVSGIAGNADSGKEPALN
jgi:hypothetical protein